MPLDLNARDIFDLVIVGGGPGGYAAALYGASAGLKIAVVEKDKVGGTCLHRGCIPAKELLETARIFVSVNKAKEYGVLSSPPVIDTSVMQGKKSAVVGRLHKGLEGLMRGRGIAIFQGVGKLLAKNVVEVIGSGGQRQLLQAKFVILATGSRPRTIPGFVPDGQYILTSDEVLDLKVIPPRALVIGGGAIGCEFASLLSDLGSKVTLAEVTSSLLPGCDEEVAEAVARSFRKKGIFVKTQAQVTNNAFTEEGVTVSFADGDSVDVDQVVISVGRAPNSASIYSEDVDIDLDERGYVMVDDRLRTKAENVFAIGDLINTPQLAHVGFAEGIFVIKQILGEQAIPVDYQNVPWCIYSSPEVAFVGLTESAARLAGYDIAVKKDPYGGNGRAIILGETEGFVKVICEKDVSGKAGRLLGVHMVGPWVTEQLGQAYLSVNWGATPEEISHFIQPHPTLSETFGETVLALTGRGLHVG